MNRSLLLMVLVNAAAYISFMAFLFFHNLSNWCTKPTMDGYWLIQGLC
jgi:hypothetical protein